MAQLQQQEQGKNNELHKEELRLLSDHYADAWVDYHDIKNEKGDQIEWTCHQFLIDIYNDQCDNLVVIKAAQIGLSTLEIIKNFRDAEMNKMDIIYTLPTDADVGIFVGGKVNRIIQNNPHMQSLTVDKDTVEQKRVGMSMIYFRGTWTKKAAIMVTADRLVHDEADSSKQDVVADYQARLQHSKFKQTHVFSHPSVPNAGVDMQWQMSDQKEWFIRCPHCGQEQYMSWNTEDPKRMSVDIINKKFICRKCHGELKNEDRKVGRWIARYDRAKHPEKKWSGYHISLLMAPWVSAEDIVNKYNEVMAGKQTMDFFYNKVLGLPYAGSGNVVLEDTVKGAWTNEKNPYKGRLIVGIDSGLHLNYVVGNKQGLVGYGIFKDWMPDDANKLALHETAEWFLIKFPDSIAVVDQGGDIIGPRKLRQKYPGRVFLCHYARDRKTMQLMRWGERDESGNVIADRNRMIQLVIDEMREKRWRLYNGQTNQDWHDYWLHWSHIYRAWEEDSIGIKRGVWLRSDRDDWVHATVYWRIGVDKFGNTGALIGAVDTPEVDSYLVNPDKTVSFNPDEMFGKQEGTEPWWVKEENDNDWRVA
jgi:hypothetical protein